MNNTRGRNLGSFQRVASVLVTMLMQKRIAVPKTATRATEPRMGNRLVKKPAKVPAAARSTRRTSCALIWKLDTLAEHRPEADSVEEVPRHFSARVWALGFGH